MLIFSRYKSRLEKRYKKDKIGRVQLNFTCDVTLITRLKLLAKYLDTPCYPLAEHCLELGIGEIAVKAKDKALIEVLQRHLLKEHLLVKDLSAIETHVSERARRVNNALKFLKLIEPKAGNPDTIEQIVDHMRKET